MIDHEKIFSQRLKELRLAKKMSLDSLGAKVSVTRQAIMKFESSKAYPAFLVLVALADALDVSLDYLVGRSDKP